MPVDSAVIEAWSDFENRYEGCLSTWWTIRLETVDIQSPAEADLHWEIANAEAPGQAGAIARAIEFAHVRQLRNGGTMTVGAALVGSGTWSRTCLPF